MDDERHGQAISGVLGALVAGIVIGLVVGQLAASRATAECGSTDGSDGCWSVVVGLAYGGVAAGLTGAVVVAAYGAWRRLGTGYCVSSTGGFLLLTAVWAAFWFGR